MILLLAVVLAFPPIKVVRPMALVPPAVLVFFFPAPIYREFDLSRAVMPVVIF